MKKTIKTEKINEAYTLLDAAKYTKMEAADRRNIVKALRHLKKVSVEFNDFREDAIKRLRPDNFEEVAALINKFNAMTTEEREAAVAEKKYTDALKANIEFNTSVNECLREELDKLVELDFTGLSETAIDAMLDSNPDWTVGQAMLVEDILAE